MFHPDFMRGVIVGTARERSMPKEVRKIRDLGRYRKRVGSVDDGKMDGVDRGCKKLSSDDNYVDRDLID